MFLKVKVNSYICYGCGIDSQGDIEIVRDEFLINMSTLCEIRIEKCFTNYINENTVTKLKYKVDFDRFVENGVVNHFSLFFTHKESKEFKKINKVIDTLLKRKINVKS